MQCHHGRLCFKHRWEPVTQLQAWLHKATHCHQQPCHVGEACRTRVTGKAVPYLEHSEQVDGCCEQLMRLEVCWQLIQHSCMLMQDILLILESHSK
jgi:hypothetical protein